MSKAPRSPFFWLMLGGSVVLTLSLGIRHGFGLFLAPMSTDLGWGRETFALAIAVQNLLWGLVQPITGAFADRFGIKPVVMVSGLLYALGLLLMGMTNSPLSLTLSTGILIGLALSGTSFSVILGAIGRAAPPEKRSSAMGIASAAGSFGQFVMLPGTLGLIEGLGWSAALFALAALSLLILPFASIMKSSTPAEASQHQTHTPSPTLRQVLTEAARHSDFWLLCFGFFVCGFQVVFIGIHLPSYLIDQQLPPQTGTTVLALVGLFNIFGTYGAGRLGERYSKPQLLAGLYLLRALVIGAFMLLPVTQASAYGFGIGMGLLWLSTVPLTNGIVASVFGVRNLSMLGGIVFLFHQLGSFLGGWLGGYLYDQTGNYDLVWQISLLLCFVAALLNWPIAERPLARPPVVSPL